MECLILLVEAIEDVGEASRRSRRVVKLDEGDEEGLAFDQGSDLGLVSSYL